MRLTSTLLLLLSLLPSSITARPWTSGDKCPEIINVVISSDRCSQYGEHCTDEPQLSTMDAVHAALISCHNITSLDLRVTGLGCSEWPSRWNFPFHPAGGEQYPHLKRLRLEGYRWDANGREDWWFPKWDYGLGYWIYDASRWLHRGHWRTWAEWRSLPQEQRAKSNFALWIDAMDWSEVEELWIDNMTPEVLSILPPYLNSLQKLETTSLDFIQTLPNNTLTDLAWIGPSQPQDLPTILAHQGASIRNLEFRCPELSCPSFHPELDFSLISSAAPYLTHLSIDVPRNGTWPLESLQAIAAIPQLQKADLYMNIQSPCSQQILDDYNSAYREYEREHGKDYCKGEERFQKPWLEETIALELFEYMRENKVGDGLEQVTFWVGDWMRPWDGPLYFPSWVEGRRAKAVCTARVGNETEKCVFEVGERYWEQEWPW
ncbi:Nn.00g010800.m01.CDS01 [Neocucurbitaria sp. VM-36]